MMGGVKQACHRWAGGRNIGEEFWIQKRSQRRGADARGGAAEEMAAGEEKLELSKMQKCSLFLRRSAGAFE